ncbi:MAG: NADH-quinone oxidoreductase subunit M [Gammaproteobacteria bacterium]|nr:NADH-quinone oxidoreductase subunit M [Gammaproteobacteria bacterium]
MITPVSLWSESVAFPVLTVMALTPLMGLAAVMFWSTAVPKIRIAVATAMLNAALSLYMLIRFNHDFTGMQFVEQVSFWGMSYSVGVDGLNILFLPLITCLSLLVLLYLSATRHAQNKPLIATVLGYQALLIAAFSAMNLLQFWLLTVVELIPVLSVIKRSGPDQNKRHLSVRLVQYFGFSLFLTLCGFMLLAFGLIDSEHDLTFDLLTLKSNNAYLHDEILIFVLLFYGFAIRMPLFPFHGWLPLLAEQSGLTSLTVLIAGAKLGVYAMIRFIFPLIPGVAEQWANYVLILCIISIFYGALLAFMQNNAYRLLAFAAISHSGMLVLGVFSFNEHGLEGTLLLSLVYGLASAGMLLSLGLIYEKTNTALIPRLGRLFDRHTALALLFLIATLSTVIMPGSLGFDAGHLLLEGVIEEHEWAVSITILIGHVLAAGFLLWAFQRIFLATPKRRIYHDNQSSGFYEGIIAFIICALHIGTGLNSMPLLKLIDKDVIALVGQYPVHSSQVPELEADGEEADVTNDEGESQ